MWTMPVIRYDTGDLAESDPKPCACGRSLPVLRRIYGRAVDSVILPDGRRLFWPFFHELLGGYEDLRQWRVIQNDIDGIKVELAMPNHNTTLLERIKANLSSALPRDIKLYLEPVDSISVTPGEKTRMVISQVNGLEKKDNT